MTNTTPAGAAMEPLWTDEKLDDEVETWLWRTELDDRTLRYLPRNQAVRFAAMVRDSERATATAQHEQLQQQLEVARAEVSKRNEKLLSLTADPESLEARVSGYQEVAEEWQRITAQATQRIAELQQELAAARAEPRYVPLPLGMQVNDLVRMVDGAPDKNDAWLLWGHISSPNPKATLLPADVRLCRLAGQDAQPQSTTQQERTAMNRQDVYRAIDSEREYQDKKWGTVEQNPHTVQEWIAILNEEIEEANWEFDDSDALAELRQVAAVCIAALEQHGCLPREGYGQDTQPPSVQPDWSYSGGATVETHGGGLLAMRMDGPFEQGRPPDGVHDVELTFTLRRPQPAPAQESSDLLDAYVGIGSIADVLRDAADNAWVERVAQLRQMVADLPDAPASVEDVEYYLSDYWQGAELDADDVRFVRAEIERQYGVASA